MFTDIVGYSSLVNENESLAHDLLEEHRRLIRPLVKEHHGREIKTVGDGFHFEFASALQAVRCAIEIQSVLHGHNLGVKAERKIQIRIGIHVGDIEAVEGDIYGDGVNIAARIEPLASPGGICISEQVYAQIANKLEALFADIGEQALKNISQPVQVYRILLPWEKENTSANKLEFQGRRSKTSSTIIILACIVIFTLTGWWVTDRLNLILNEPAEQKGISSIAILPFEDLSPAADNEYFCDGLSEELINAMSSIAEDFKVVSRTSAFQFRGHNLDVRDIGERLGVEAIVEGSVRKDGDRLRVTAQLIKTEDGFHLWSEIFDRRIEDVFDIQEEIATAIATHIKPALSPGSETNLIDNQTSNLEAYDNYQLGQYFYRQWRRDLSNFDNALRYFEEAIELDPEYAQAYASLALVYFTMLDQQQIPREEAIPLGKAALERALELDNRSEEAYFAKTLMAFYEGDLSRGEEFLNDALELNPNYADAHRLYGSLLEVQGRLEQGLAHSKKAVELDPLFAGNHLSMAVRLASLKRYAEAIISIENALELEPAYLNAQMWLANVRRDMWEWDIAEEEYLTAIEMIADKSIRYLDYAELLMILGRFSEAKRLIQKAIDNAPFARQTHLYMGIAAYLSRDFEEALRHLDKSLEIDPVSYILPHQWLAAVYIAKNMYTKALRELQNLESKSKGAFGEEEKNALIYRGIIHARQGQEEKAKEQMEILRSDREAVQRENATGLALIYLALGNFDATFEQLSEAYDNHAVDLYIMVNPLYDDIRLDPRYADLLIKMGLEQPSG
jgi:TolB-like protein/class 3 adenylate cyclase/Tfp pilus assembly protein PilF